MSPLILLLLALLGAVIVQAFIRTRVASQHRWVAVGRPRIAIARKAGEAAYARSVESAQAAGDWENEGGAIAPEASLT